MVAAFQVIGRHFVTPAALLKQSKHSASQESKPPRSSCAQCNSSGSPCPIGFKGQLELLLSAKLISKRFQLALQKWAFLNSFHCLVFFFLFNSMLFGKKPNSAGMAVPEEPSQPLGRGLLIPWCSPTPGVCGPPAHRLSGTAPPAECNTESRPSAAPLYHRLLFLLISDEDPRDCPASPASSAGLSIGKIKLPSEAVCPALLPAWLCPLGCAASPLLPAHTQSQCHAPSAA